MERLWITEIQMQSQSSVYVESDFLLSTSPFLSLRNLLMNGETSSF